MRPIVPNASEANPTEERGRILPNASEVDANGSEGWTWAIGVRNERK